MSNEHLISIIVPIYNIEKYLEKCINSILVQTYKNLEILLVDDGSTDDSLCICSELASVDKRIRVIHKENKGVASARNIGLDNATGEFIGFVDPDDWIEPEMYNNLINEMMLEKSIDVAVCGYFCETKNNILKYCVDDKKKIKGVTAVESLFDDVVGNFTWNKLFRRKIFDELRFPQLECFEDISIMYHVFNKANCVVVLPDVCYHYCRRKESLIGRRSLSYAISRCEVMQKRHKFVCENYRELEKQSFESVADAYCRISYANMLSKDKNKKAITSKRKNICKTFCNMHAGECKLYLKRLERLEVYCSTRCNYFMDLLATLLGVLKRIGGKI